MSQEYVRAFVVEPQGSYVYETEVRYDDNLDELCGGPIEVIGLRDVTHDSHALELYKGDPNLYHPDHAFELDGERHIGTCVVMARNERCELVDVDVSVKWVRDRVRFL